MLVCGPDFTGLRLVGRGAQVRLVGVWSRKERPGEGRSVSPPWSLSLSSTLPECPRTQGPDLKLQERVPPATWSAGCFPAVSAGCPQGGSWRHGGQANSSSFISGWGAGVHTSGVTKQDDALSTWPGTLSPLPSVWDGLSPPDGSDMLSPPILTLHSPSLR